MWVNQAYHSETNWNKSAKTIAKSLLEDIILKYGNFKILKSDGGTELIKQICATLNIEQKLWTSYHQENLRDHNPLTEF